MSEHVGLVGVITYMRVGLFLAKVSARSGSERRHLATHEWHSEHGGLERAQCGTASTYSSG